jgi:hypothetical protein
MQCHVEASTSFLAGLTVHFVFDLIVAGLALLGVRSLTKGLHSRIHSGCTSHSSQKRNTT